MNYQQTVEYLYTCLPMFSRVGAAAYKADLDNTIALCALAGDPQKKFKSIHVAGTNGKGSVSHMLAAVFQAAGYKTGLYTSPHLKDFRERIKVDGKFISEDFVVDYVQDIQPAINKLSPSFFEITVAMAFSYFEKQQVDIAIIEVGLGGRLDSTNVIQPELSIITNIGRDHMNLLGNTIQEIAGEKAGIIKNNIPVVIGEYNTLTHEVFEKKAAEMHAALVFADKKKWVAEWTIERSHLQVAIGDNELDEAHKNYTLDLNGIYQVKNVLPVLEAISQMQRSGWQISEDHIKEGLANVKKYTGLHGRWETIQQKPWVVLDVAHNQEGMMQLLQQLELSEYNHLHIVLGFVKDKEVDTLLQLLPGHATYYFTKSQIPRALQEDDLADMAAKFNLNGRAFAEVNKALKQAISNAQPNDLVLVCGSVFLVGEVNALSVS